MICATWLRSVDNRFLSLRFSLSRESSNNISFLQLTALVSSQMVGVFLPISGTENFEALTIQSVVVDLREVTRCRRQCTILCYPSSLVFWVGFFHIKWNQSITMKVDDSFVFFLVLLPWALKKMEGWPRAILSLLLEIFNDVHVW